MIGSLRVCLSARSLDHCLVLPAGGHTYVWGHITRVMYVYTLYSNTIYDGRTGTVGRWVEVLTEWNPGLSDPAALAVIEAFFGLKLPGVQVCSHVSHSLTT